MVGGNWEDMDKFFIGCVQHQYIQGLEGEEVVSVN